MSAGVRRLARARSVSSLRCFAMSPSASLSAFLMTAVTTAFSTAIASATFTSACMAIEPLFQLPFIRGKWRSDRATAATRMSVCVTFTPCDRSISGTRRVREALRFGRIDGAGDVELRHLRPALRRALGHDLADRRHGAGVGGGAARARRGAGVAAGAGAAGGRRRPPPRRRHARRLHDVVGENLAAGAGAAHLGDVDAVLARQTARLRRNLGAGHGRGRGGFRRGGAAAAAAGADSILRPLCCGAPALGRHRLAGLQQPRDDLPHGHDVIDLGGHAGQHAVGGRLRSRPPPCRSRPRAGSRLS